MESAGDLEAALAAEEKIGVASPARLFVPGIRPPRGGEGAGRRGAFATRRSVSSRPDATKKGLNSGSRGMVPWSSAQTKAGDVKGALETADSIPDDLFHVAALCRG